MKLLSFSDLHAHLWPEFSTIVNDPDHGSISSRLQDTLNFFRWVERQIAKHEIDAFVFQGDLFHRKRLIEVSVYNKVAEAVQSLARLRPLYLMVGNHDMAMETLVDHGIAPFRRYHNVTVVDSHDSKSIPGVGMVSFCRDNGELLRRVHEVTNKKMRVLLLHAGIDGATVGQLEARPFIALKASDLPPVRVYSGHYHKPQVIEREDDLPPITYVGSPFEILPNDGYSEHRGAVIIDTETGRGKRLLYGGPRFLTVAQTAFPHDDLDGHYVTVVMSDPDKKEEERIAATSKARGLRFITAAPQASRAARIKVANVQKGQMPTIGDMVNAYVEHAAANESTKYRERLRQLGNELLWGRS